MNIVIDNEFQESQPCNTIYYAHDETLEHSDCCIIGVWINTLTILVRKVRRQEISLSQFPAKKEGNELQYL